MSKTKSEIDSHEDDGILVEPIPDDLKESADAEMKEFIDRKRLTD